tara:strand:+ start:7080 stop:7307 length:228 start_codon:yes stop_codon:yes gene_type:complete
MDKYTKTINGYLCEVEIDNDNEPSTQGWVSKGSCSGSLQSVLDQGYFTTDCGANQYEITDSILLRIEMWADSVGY